MEDKFVKRIRRGSTQTKKVAKPVTFEEVDLFVDQLPIDDQESLASFKAKTKKKGFSKKTAKKKALDKAKFKNSPKHNRPSKKGPQR